MDSDKFDVPASQPAYTITHHLILRLPACLRVSLEEHHRRKCVFSVAIKRAPGDEPPVDERKGSESVEDGPWKHPSLKKKLNNQRDAKLPKTNKYQALSPQSCISTNRNGRVRLSLRKVGKKVVVVVVGGKNKQNKQSKKGPVRRSGRGGLLKMGSN